MTRLTLASELRHRLTVYQRVAAVQDGEDRYTYEAVGRVWGALSVSRGALERLEGGMERPDVTHRLLLRRGACHLTSDTYFVYQGQRYDVLYWQPYYRKADRVEVLLRMVVEDGE